MRWSKGNAWGRKKKNQPVPEPTPEPEPEPTPEPEPEPTPPPPPPVLVGHDETLAVQAALDIQGSFTVDRAYRIDSPLVPPPGSTITFAPGGKFVRTDDVGYGVRKWPVVELRHGGVTILDPVIEGPNTGRYDYGAGRVAAHEGTGIGGVDPNMEESGGLYFTGGSGYYIRNPWIESVWGDGITILGGSDITIDNPQIQYVGRSLVSNVNGTNVTINDGFGHGAFWWGFNMEPIGARVVQTFDVNGFDLGWNRFDQVFAGGPYFNCQVYDVNIDVDWQTDWRGIKVDPCVAHEVTVR